MENPLSHSSAFTPGHVRANSRLADHPLERPYAVRSFFPMFGKIMLPYEVSSSKNSFL